MMDREHWEREPFGTLCKTFRHQWKEYKEGDLVIVVPRSKEEDDDSSMCWPAFIAWGRAQRIAIGVWFCGSGKLTFAASYGNIKPVERFNKYVTLMEECGQTPFYFDFDKQCRDRKKKSLDKIS